jgi:hypothetical protein
MRTVWASCVGDLVISLRRLNSQYQLWYTNVTDEPVTRRQKAVVIGIEGLWRLIRGILSHMILKQQNLEQNKSLTITKKLHSGIKLMKGVGND